MPVATTRQLQGTREDRRGGGGSADRERLLAGLPLTERRLELAGISTAVLEGGEGPPIVLLHGPGEFAAKWMRIVPDLVRDHHVVAPDLPAHGASEVPNGGFDVDRASGWLGELIARTCASRPAVVGHVIGGAIAARYAIEHSDRLRHLVLVDSLGLGRFRPAPKFALTMLAFQARPNRRSYERFMRQCSYDLDALRGDMGARWEPFAAYSVDGARSPASKAVGRMMRELGIPRIPPSALERITAPTALIWGRQDRANRLPVAEAASERYGWPLRVVDDCADDPPRDRPQAFLAELRSLLAVTDTTQAATTFDRGGAR